MRRAQVAIAVVALGVAQPAHAQNSMARASWIIDLSKVEGTVDVRKGKTIVSLPVFPNKLITIDGPVVDVGTNGVKVSAGKQFIEYRLASGKTVFCSSQTLDRMKDGGSIFYFRYEGTYVCLVDQDDDARLDGVYEVKSNLMSGTPIITHGKESGYEAINPITFRYIDRKDFNNPMSFKIDWWRGSGIGDRFHVSPSLKAEMGEDLTLNQYAGLDVGAVPGSFTYLGIKFEVSGDRPNHARVTLERQANFVTMNTYGASVDFQVGE